MRGSLSITSGVEPRLESPSLGAGGVAHLTRWVNTQLCICELGGPKAPPREGVEQLPKDTSLL